jgi:type III secretion protein I
MNISTTALQPTLGIDDLAPASGPGTADGAASVRFSDIMDRPDAATSVDAASAVESAKEPASGSLGDRILHGLNSMSAEMKDTWSHAAHLINGSGPLRLNDMLTVQMTMAQMSINYEIVGKAVGRSTQNIDQLVKLQ